jgi:putative oxidoreductase
MKSLTSIGRIILAVPFVLFGLNHLIHAQAMQGMVPSFVPGGIFWIYFTGLALIAAGVAMIAQKYAKLAGLLLAGLLLTFIVTLHLPGLFVQQTQQMAMVGLLKDMALAGGALMVAGTTKN